MALCATTVLAGAVPRLCVRGTRGWFGGPGRYLALCLPRFPLPAPRVPRCVWRAVPSGCPLPSPAGTPFHAVCAFRALGPVALPVVPACPYRVCALALSGCPLPPPLGGVACASRVVPALGAGRAVPRGPCPSACPAPVPCSVWRAWGGAVRSRFPPTGLGVAGVAAGCPLGGVPSTVVWGVWGHALPLPRRPAHWAGCRGPRSTCCGRGRAGVGALLCPIGRHVLRVLRAAGRVRGFHMLGGGPGGGGGLIPSLCLPSAGNKAGVTGGVLSVGGVAPHTTPVRAHQASRGTICAASRCAGAGSFVLRSPHGSRRLGRGGSSHSSSSLGRGGTIPPASGGGSRGPCGLRAGGGAGGGGVAPRPPCSPSGRRPAILHPGHLCVAGALPSGVRVRSGPKCRPGVGGGVGAARVPLPRGP